MEPVTPPRKTNITMPKTPKKIRTSEGKYLKVLLGNYNALRRNQNPRHIQKLVMDTFNYLKSFFSIEIQRHYFDELKETLNELYGDRPLHLEYDLLRLLGNVVSRVSIMEQNNYLEEEFKSILDELKDDRTAVTLTDSDLHEIIEYVKDSLVGDDIKHSVASQSRQLAFDKLGVGGKLRKHKKIRKIKKTRKSRKNNKKNKKSKTSKTRKRK